MKQINEEADAEEQSLRISLDAKATVDAVIQFTSTMTWKGNHPVVTLVTTTYPTGVKLTKEAMEVVETHLQRWPSLEKWFVDIPHVLPTDRDN